MKVFLSNHQKMSFLLRSICFLFLVSSFLNTFVSATQHLCHPDQRDTLLEFKTEFLIKKRAFVYVSSYPKTKSWVNKSDCCSWDGITCDTKSGKVIGLDLSSSDLHGELKSNSSLFRLRHLRDLNLSRNNFTDSPIPAEFYKLMELERLNLSRSSLSGQIPNKLLQLTKLVSLDLSCYPSYFPFTPLSIDESFLHLLAQNLRNLRELNMRSVNISSEIPLEFFNMRSLRLLDLKDCNLFGKFPSSVFLIPSLQSIRLSFNPNLRGNLPLFHVNNSLLKLSIKLTAFSGTIPDSISSLKQLRFLTLSFSKFSGKIPFSLWNLSHLSYLDLSYNNFVGVIPSSIGNLNQLTYFDVGANKLSGNLPATISNLTQLRVLSLSFNQFTGSLPPNISQLSKLNSFGVDGITGAILLSLLKIPSLTKISLDYSQPNDLLGIENISLLPNLIDISIFHSSFNKIGLIDLNVFSPLKQLSFLDLSGIPLSTANITSDSDFPSNLDKLRLLGCNITEFPEFIRNEKNLEYLDLSNNKIGLIDLNVFSPLKQLSFLDLSGIPLSTAKFTFDFSSNLEHLYLRGCNITEFPEFIRNEKNLEYLDLSNNKIKGQVPDGLWRLPKLSYVNLSNNSLSGFNESFKSSPGSKIGYLDVSSNAFQGPLFIPSRSLEYFSSSKNNFTGEIPRSICGQSSLEVLDLSHNNLHGSIPQCLDTLMSSLLDINLRNNSLNGSLPEIFMNAKDLISLDVSHNRLEGKLPASLTGCSALEVLNVGSNRINDTFPFQLNSLPKLQVLVIRSNKFHGMLHNADGVWFGFPQLKIIDASYNDFLDTLPSDYFLNWTAMSSKRDNNVEPEYIESSSGRYYSLVLMSKGVSMEMERILTIYTAIDFSGNQLHGQIPDSIGLLKELRILNLSSNAFTGHIPSSMANLTNLESLDLSQNKISGEIPPELGTISSLAVINVSHNQLEGSIPQGTQFQRQQCSSYEGNPGLNRPSLKDVCRDIKAPPQHEPLETKEEEEEESLSWIAACLGFGPGVVFGLAMGYIMTSNKQEWFMKTFGLRKQQSTRTR